MVFKWFALGNKPSKTFEFQCSDCGEIHRGSPSFGFDKPPYYFLIPESDRAERVKADADTCVVDDDAFFIRALLEIPIVDVEEPFAWGVWVSQSEESFKRYVETYDRDQSGDGSFGWLAVAIPGYVEGVDDGDWEELACDVNWRGDRHRPLISLHECDHRLYADFVNGISWDRAIELARRVMHPD